MYKLQVIARLLSTSKQKQKNFDVQSLIIYIALFFRFYPIVAYTEYTIQIQVSFGIKRSSSSAPEKKTNFPLSADFFSYHACLPSYKLKDTYFYGLLISFVHTAHCWYVHILKFEITHCSKNRKIRVCLLEFFFKNLYLDGQYETQKPKKSSQNFRSIFSLPIIRFSSSFS